MKGDKEAALQLAKDELGMVCDDDSTEIVGFEEALAVPRIKHTAGLIRFWWDTEQVQVAVSRMHAHKDGRITGEIRITTTAPGYRPHLHQAQLNFAATRSKQELAKFLDSRMNDVDWHTIIEQISQYSIDHMRQGEPVLELWTCDDVKPPEYVLSPLLPKLQPTVIYGLGGTGKSMLALLCGMIIQLPWDDNPLKLSITTRAPVLYLDWETDESEIRWRMACLRRGMGMLDLSLHYRRCALALADDTERIRQSILDKNISFLIVDSIGAACGGDLNSAEPAIRMFTAIRELKVTSLLLAHTAKNVGGKDTTIFGSSFFNFYARNVWELKKAQETGQDNISVGLYHRKANMSRLHQPLGYKFSFSENTAKIETQQIARVSDLAEHLPVRTRIQDTLGRYGKMKVKDIAEMINATEGTVRDKLNDMRHRKEVNRDEMGNWSLLSDRSTT